MTTIKQQPEISNLEKKDPKKPKIQIVDYVTISGICEIYSVLKCYYCTVGNVFLEY